MKICSKLTFDREIITTNNWPENMEYLTCDNYTGSNTPIRSLNLRSFFVNISEPATYGKFSFGNANVPFNGNSALTFDMDILSVSIRNGIEYNENSIGTWAAGFTSPLVIKSNKSVEDLKAKRIYRVYTVVVSMDSMFII